MVLTVRSVYLFLITDLIAPERLVKVMTLVACLVHIYSQLSLNGHLNKTDTSVKQTLRVGPCLSFI